MRRGWRLRRGYESGGGGARGGQRGCWAWLVQKKGKAGGGCLWMSLSVNLFLRRSVGLPAGSCLLVMVLHWKSRKGPGLGVRDRITYFLEGLMLPLNWGVSTTWCGVVQRGAAWYNVVRCGAVCCDVGCSDVVWSTPRPIRTARAKQGIADLTNEPPRAGDDG